jgi:predicted ATPase
MEVDLVNGIVAIDQMAVEDASITFLLDGFLEELFVGGVVLQ